MKPFLLLLLAATVSLPACKKETAFSAKGYWEGLFFIHRAALLHQADGSSRIYLKLVNQDTTTAIKYNGKVIFTANGFNAMYTDGTDTIYLEAAAVSKKMVRGLGWTSSSPGDAFPSEFTKK